LTYPIENNEKWLIDRYNLPQRCDMLRSGQEGAPILAGRSSQIIQSVAISRAIEARSHAEVVREHVRQLAGSAAFKGSERSREFLLVIVEKALTGHFEDLKERVLGVELFGREASYNTGEDAIVRVTASDVRRRLQRYYSEIEKDAKLRLDIPVGSYIPEFRWTVEEEVAPAVEEPAAELIAEPEEIYPAAVTNGAGRKWRWPPPTAFYAAGAFLFGVLGSGLLSQFVNNRRAPETLPWTFLAQSGRRLQIVVSDPDLSKMQALGEYNLSLSDYANRRYLPADLSVSPDLNRVLRFFRGTSMGTVEVTAALGISKHVFPQTQQVTILPARGVQLKDFQTDDNFVLLGSPRSNPWVSLFQDQLDFQFYYDTEAANEFVRNQKPLKGEPSIYRPSARGWGTGDAFGLISFIANPNQSGHVLLIAGSSAEATEAAGRFVLERDAMMAILQKNGILPGSGIISFQLLLQVTTMAGSPNSFTPISFHQLHLN
jgi:hypothetical protein